MTTWDFAQRYQGAGISVIPIARDGLKRPDGRLLPVAWDEQAGKYKAVWHPFQDQPPTAAQTEAWWKQDARGGKVTPGIAAVCGAVSGGLELIDFDRHAQVIFPEWSGLVEEEFPGLLARLSIVETPRRPCGYHVWLRCPDMTTPGNTRLAMPSRADIEEERALAEAEGRKAELVLIETRGEGGYALVPGCPGDCHETGRYYRFRGRPLWEVEAIGIEERDCLERCARIFSATEPDPKPQTPNTKHQPDDPDVILPGTAFDLAGPDWADILAPHGWQLMRRTGEARLWRRPGKTRGGWSASTDHCRGERGEPLLYVFSSNAWPLEPGRCYGRFRTLARLEFGGDLTACARALRVMGYGSAVVRKGTHGGQQRRGGEQLVP